jgi:hypothetical protein
MSRSGDTTFDLKLQWLQIESDFRSASATPVQALGNTQDEIG